MREPPTQRFHLGDVLSVTTGKMLSPRRLSGVYALLRHLRHGAPVHTCQISALRAVSKPHLLKHFPQLSSVDMSEASRRDLQPLLAKACAEHGPWLDVPPLPLETLQDTELPSRTVNRAALVHSDLTAVLQSEPSEALEEKLADAWSQLTSTAAELPPWATAKALRHAWSVPWVQHGHTSPSTNSTSKLYQDVRRRWANALRVQLSCSTAQPLRHCGVVVVRHAPTPLRWGPALAGLAPLLDVLVPKSPEQPQGLGVICEDSTLGMPGGVVLAQHLCTPDMASTHVYVFERPPAAQPLSAREAGD